MSIKYIDIGKNLFVSKVKIGKRKNIKTVVNIGDYEETIAFCRSKYSTVYRGKPYIVWCDVKWLIRDDLPILHLGKSSKRNNRNIVAKPISNLNKIRKAKMTDCMAFKYFILNKESDIDE